MNVTDAANVLNRTHTQYLNAQKALRVALADRSSTPGRKVAECGTEAGYVAHYRVGEAACAACSYARSWANKKRKNGVA